MRRVASLCLVSCATASFRFSSVAVPPSGHPSTPVDVQAAAKKFASTMRVHRVTGDPKLRKRLELQAWRDLQVLDDTDVEVLQTTAVCELLSAWAYFSKFWEQGHEGPSHPLPAGSGPDPEDIAINDPGPLPNPNAPIKRQIEYEVQNKSIERPRRNILEETFE